MVQVFGQRIASLDTIKVHKLKSVWEMKIKKAFLKHNGPLTEICFLEYNKDFNFGPIKM
jgi:hypothetical protein